MVDDRDVVRAEAAGRGRFVRRSSRAGPVNSTKLIAPAATVGENSLAAEHPLELVPPLAPRRAPRSACASGRPAPSRRGSAGRRRLAICGRCVIVTTCARPARRRSVSATACAVCAADAGVDLVEDDRLAAADGRDRERDARELAARGRLGDRARTAGPGSAGSGTTASSAPVGAGLALAQLDAELAVAHADARAAPRRPRPRTGSAAARARRRAARRRAPSTRASAARERLARPPRPGSKPASSACELGPRLRGPREQLLVGRAAEAPARVGDPVELGLDLLEPAGLRLQRGEERAQLATPSRAGAARRRAARPPARCELRREPLDAARAPARRPRRARRRPRPRRARAPRPRAAAPAASSVTWRSRSRSLAQRVLGARLEALGVLDERAQLGEARLARRRRPRVSSSWRRRAAASSRQAARSSARRRCCSSPAKASSSVELVRRPREAALLELARHRDQPLGRARRRPRGRRCGPRRRRACGRRRRRAARARARPRPRAAARRARRARRRRRSPSRQVELGLDVGLVAAGPTSAGVALRAEQEPDRLREDRLAGAGLARDRVQAGREGELGLADEDEVLDAEATKQRSRR